MDNIFDFDTLHDRRGTGSLKWDVGEKELPMWVADMDFKTAPEITESLVKKASEGIFGYSVVPEEWQEAIQNRWAKYGLAMEKEWLIFCTGVIPAVTCAVKRMTNVGDNVVVQTPVYGVFFNSIENQGRHALENPLIYDGLRYSVDFADLEKKLSHPLTTLMILCNPQNPAGNVWSKEELARIGELCKKYHVTVLSDEIHCELTVPGVTYTPFASVSEVCKNNSITCISASKTFNLAGLQSAAVIIPDERIRQIMNRGLNSDEVAEPNVFAMAGTIAAYTKGDAWLTALREYLFKNRKIVEEFLKKELPQLVMTPQEATYLLWIYVGNVAEDSGRLCDFIRKETGLYMSKGEGFRGNGRLFVRLNIACPKERLLDGLARLKKGVELYLQQSGNRQ